MSDTLHTLLDAGLSRTTTPDTERELELLAIEAEWVGTQHPHVPILRRGLTLGLAAILAVGGATTAVAAAPALWEWLGFSADVTGTVTLPSGVDCEVGYIVRPDPASTGDQSLAIESARNYLSGLDLSTLPVARQLTELEAEGDFFIGQPQADREGQALDVLVSRSVSTHVEAAGFSPEFVIEGAAQCE